LHSREQFSRNSIEHSDFNFENSEAKTIKARMMIAKEMRRNLLFIYKIVLKIFLCGKYQMENILSFLYYL